ncbi:MAG TPA: F0F1 ATP synthase subunit B [Candidatus Caccomonas pullistercoris]|nr:F0F1 ATP synthase subunit B [Candidatus Caccomonas pullistercoris]
MPSFFTPDFGLLFWMFITFLVVLVVVGKFGFPAIVKMVEERKAYIDESLNKAREANEKLANIKAESEQILKKAREQQAQILKEAMATRDNIVKDAQIKAQVEGQRILDEAKDLIRVEKENALKDIREQVAELSIQIAEKMLRKELKKSSEQTEMIDRLLNEIVTKN